jgi:alpha-ketoglutarate-dependent taurine dioxygenase
MLLDVRPNAQTLTEWARAAHAELETALSRDGAILIRGLKFHASGQFRQVLEGLFGESLLEYVYRSTPRTRLGGNVYTATEYPPEETIPQHNENAYANAWPMRIGFLCMIPSATGGATPLADSRRVYDRIPRSIREEFAARKITYVRNYGRMDLPWTEVFQTQDRAQVESFCSDNHIEVEWVDDDHLRTRQTTPATAVHPLSGEPVWFNQAHLFHVSSLGADAQKALLSLFSTADLPRNAYFGDGGEIDESSLAAIRRVYEQERFWFPWRKDDLLLLDNMLVTHGRQPYTGDRKVLVGMARRHGSDA